MNLVLLPGVRLFAALWGGLAVAAFTRTLPDQLLALALLVVLVVHHQPHTTALASAAIVALVDNGFVVHDFGALGWTSAADVARSLLLLLVGLLASGGGR